MQDFTKSALTEIKKMKEENWYNANVAPLSFSSYARTTLLYLQKVMVTDDKKGKNTYHTLVKFVKIMDKYSCIHDTQHLRHKKHSKYSTDGKKYFYFTYTNMFEVAHDVGCELINRLTGYLPLCTYGYEKYMSNEYGLGGDTDDYVEE